MIMETERLRLRELTPEDLDALYAVLGDSDIMRHYPYTFDTARVGNWIRRNQQRYGVFGFGLWTVCRKDTGELIGDCGITMQQIDRVILPEIGYHIRRDCQRQGYAREALAAVIQAFFEKTDTVLFTGGHYAYNTISGELLKMLGFTYEGIEHKAMRHAERGPTDLVCYYLEK